MDKNKVKTAITLQAKIDRINEYLNTVEVKINCANYQNFYLWTGIDAKENEQRLTKNFNAQIKRVRGKLQKELDEL